MGKRENRTDIFEIPNDPKLADLFRSFMQQIKLQISAHVPARVIAYNPATKRVEVEVGFLPVFKDLETQPTRRNPNPVKVQDPIILSDIPVGWPKSDSAHITFPLNPGDTGELHVHDRSLEQWLAPLSDGSAVDPVATWSHNLADSVFHPTLTAGTNQISGPTDPTDAVFHVASGLKLGDIAATDFVVTALKIVGELNLRNTTFDTHTQPVASPLGPLVAGPPLVPMVPYTPAPIQSTKVKAT